MTKTLRIATRESQLALWQAEHVRERLLADDPGLTVELLPMKTRGDKILDVPLAKIGGKGLFLKEIQAALLRGDADVAVHSMKDVPAEPADGLELVATTTRADPMDALCSRVGTFDELPQGAHIGTSSVRRTAQLKHLRPDLRISSLRGNVNTRLRKLDDGEFDAIVLAAAGLTRLGFDERITERLVPPRFLPAVTQGVLAIEVRAGDDATAERVRRVLHDSEEAPAVAAERAFLARLEGSCQTPLACYARVEGGELVADGLLADLEGSTILRESVRGPLVDGAALGKGLAETLLDRGGSEILAAIASTDS